MNPFRSAREEEGEDADDEDDGGDGDHSSISSDSIARLATVVDFGFGTYKTYTGPESESGNNAGDGIQQESKRSTAVFSIPSPKLLFSRLA